MALTTEAFEAVVPLLDGVARDNRLLYDLEKALREDAVTSGGDEHDVRMLLADVCSYYLARPIDISKPYDPMMWLVGGRRTAAPEDLSDEAIEFFSSVADKVKVTELRARIWDLVWLGRRDPQAARDAIQAWISLPLDEDAWFSGRAETWERALDLSRRMGDTAVTGQVVAMLHDSVLTSDGFAFVCQVSKLLVKTPLADADRSSVLQHLEQLATACTGRQQRDLLESALMWAARLKDDGKREDLKHSIVQSWMEEGDSHRSGETASSFAAARCYEQALQALRQIPRKARDRLGIANMESQIRANHKETTSHIHEELTAIRTALPVDGKQLAEQSIRRISGLDRADVLAVFASLCPVQPYADLHDSARDAEKGSISGIVESISLTPEGRKARTTNGDDLIHGVRAPVWRLMEHSFEMMMTLAVQAMLEPMLAAIQAEHVLRERDFASLAIAGGVVPRNHRQLFTHALWCGYRGDWSASIHILVPQIEALVRTQFQLRGLPTTTIDVADGVENEVGLSTLVKKDEMVEIFGPDLTLYFRMLFAGPAGLNVRNTVAHGLLIDDAVESVTNLFVWWFALYLLAMAVQAPQGRPKNGGTSPTTAGK